MYHACSPRRNLRDVRIAARAIAASLAALLVAAPAASAQGEDPRPIPEGDHEQPAFIGAPATPRPVSAPPLAPRHPYMAPNERSNIHDDAYMTDAYTGPGPLGRGLTRRSTFHARECASVTFDSRDRIVTICVGLDRPELVLMDPVSLKALARFPLPPREPGAGNPFQDFTGGGYFYLDHRDRAVIPTTTRHLLVVGLTDGPAWRVERDVDLNGAIERGDKITSVLPDWSGRIWFVTQRGIVGTVARDAPTIRTFDTREPITNSFSVDETGGVFIVSDGALYRFDAAPDGTPKVTWRETYENSGVQKPGQVSPGSGTTPTLMANGLVSITDNAEQLHVAVYRRARMVSGPRFVCRVPVFARGRGSTDNSLIAAGGAIVVENNYGYTGPGATQLGRSTEPGLERVDVTPDGKGCRRVWRSNERAPSVVPKLSLSNGLVYTYTKDPSEQQEDVWRFTALDFRTGQTVYKALSGEGLGFNNNYAPITLGPDGTAYVGVMGGLVRLADATPPPRLTARPGTRPGGPRRCLPARLRFRRTRLGAVRLGARRSTLARLGARGGRRAVRLCTRRGSVRVALDARGRAVLIASTARGHRGAGLVPGKTLRQLRRALPDRRRVARGVYASGPSRTMLFGVRSGRVRWIAIVPRSLARRPAALRRALRAAL
jgi:hypothetical protein